MARGVDGQRHRKASTGGITGDQSPFCGTSRPPGNTTIGDATLTAALVTVSQPALRKVVSIDMWKKLFRRTHILKFISYKICAAWNIYLTAAPNCWPAAAAKKRAVRAAGGHFI